MTKQKCTSLDKYLDDEVACAYETRVPKGFSSRNWAFLAFGLGVLFCGIGVFMAHDAAMGKVAFWSNPVVLFGIGLALYCNLIGLSMLFFKWTWTSIQMGLLGLCSLAIYYAFSGASLADILLYGDAPSEIKILVFVLSFSWNTYWILITARGCRAIWADESLQHSVWVKYKDATVYRQFGAKAAMNKVGIRAHPDNIVIVMAILLMIPIAWWRKEISIFFGVPSVHIFSVIGQSVMVMGLIFSTMAIMLMIYYPMRIKRATGKPVLLDMMAPAKAPIPSPQI